MGKKIAFTFLILFIIVSIAACSGSKDSKDDTAATQDISRYGAPERRYDLQGQVKSIRGNEVTVNEVIGEQLELSEEERTKRRQEMQNLSPEERQKSREDRLKISDETQAFIVPVGVPIISSQNMGGKPEVKKMDLADIQKGSLLKIWFKDDSNNGEAEFIQIMNSGGI